MGEETGRPSLALTGETFKVVTSKLDVNFPDSSGDNKKITLDYSPGDQVRSYVYIRMISLSYPSICVGPVSVSIIVFI